MRKGENNVVELHCLPKFKECAWAKCLLHPCGPVTLPGVPWGFSSDKLLQVQSPKKIFCHSNIPTWRQASVL